MKPYKAQSVWHNWLSKKNTAQIAKIVDEPEWEVDKILHQYLQRRHEVRETLRELGNAE